MEKKLAYFGHHKCGSAWLGSIMQDIASMIQSRYTLYHNPEAFHENLEKTLDENKIEIFTFSNANDKFLKGIEINILGFHVIRDPRDVVVSAYYSHLFSHSVKKGHHIRKIRSALKSMTQAEGLFFEMKQRRNQFREMYEWDYTRSNIREVRLEDFMGDPIPLLKDIFRHLGILENENNKLNSDHRVIPQEDFDKLIENRTFKILSKGRDQGVEDIKSHYRKGIAGDWKNNFNEEHIDFFKKNYNHVLMKLGYEKNDDWGID